uniref:Helix-turn-helix transcriptional regulator n=1 Tax=Thermosporothrix sp. COM3 TaxID=2490863 RepID=A0A455SDT0_9CHLR|nr:helix-turn-helix transcriptional regulator [Thermosporothrix sp. COM3]
MPHYPYITQGLLYPASEAKPIALDTADWFTWVEQHTAFTYQEPPFRFSARREERPGGQYWYAYRRMQGRLYKRYLGRTKDLTAAHMQKIAQLLHMQPEHPVPQPVPLITTRFAIPRLLSEYVPRPRLLESLQRALERPCTLITGPAGSGKTTLMTQAGERLQKQGWRLAWLSLESSEQDVTRFWYYLLNAIERIVPGTAREALQALQMLPLPPVDELLMPLINALSKPQQPLLLVLDDYFLATTPEIDTGLLFLIQHMPDSLRLVVISRTKPAWPLTRLYVRGQLAEIEQTDLRFTKNEAAQFLQQTMRLHLTPTQVATLEAQTEGWVAGLQLAALSLRHQSDIDTYLHTFDEQNRSLHNRYIAAYLIDEVLNEQPPELQEFLLLTSVASRLCGPLCDAITGRSDGQRTLEKLEAANLFIVALDQQWYRYHHLFADTLRERLAQQDSALLARSHERAARWFATQGETQDAIRHALAAQAYPLAAALLEAEAELMLQRGETTTLLAWLHKLPHILLDDHPNLALASGLAQFITGEIEQASATLQRLEQAQLAEKAQQGKLATLQALILLIQEGTPQQAMEHSTMALQFLPAHQTIWRDIATLLHEAIDLLFRGSNEALQKLTALAHSSLRHGNYLIASFALENRSLKELGQGRLHQIERTCQEALRITPPNLISFTHWAYLHLGDLYREWNQPERARKMLETGLTLDRPYTYPEIVVDGYIALARVYEQLDEPRRADETIETAMSLLDRLAPHTAWQVQACRARILLVRGQHTEAKQWSEAYVASLKQAQPPFPLIEFSHFTLARIYMAQNNDTAAHTLLHTMLQTARELKRWRTVIEADLLLALLKQRHNQPEQAAHLLTEALDLAAPEGFIRLFLDEEQPLLDLLSHSLTARLLTSPTVVRYARKLLMLSSREAPAPLPEALTERELEILQLLASGKSNDAIARALFLALSTVKWHIMNIYRKLAVSTRMQAVTRARELKLIDE